MTAKALATVLILGVLEGCTGSGVMPSGTAAANPPARSEKPGPLPPAKVKPAPVPARVGPLPAPTATPGLIEDPTGQVLWPLFERLRAVEGKQPDARARIVIIGDSLTAGDFAGSTMRGELQARFGDAGRGFMLPGKPIHHYYQGDAAYGTTGEWTVEYGMKRAAIEPVGLGGVRIHSASKNVLAWTGTCATPRCVSGKFVSRFELYTRKLPGAGTLEIQIDDQPWQPISLAAPKGSEPELFFPSIDVPDGAHKLAMRPKGDGEVELMGLVFERNQPGVVVDSIGVVGAQALHLWRWDWTVIGPQLAHRDPALVIIAYGTNEADDDDLDLAKLETRYVELIGRIRAAVPGASILIQGPPDMGKRELGSKCNKLEKAALKAAAKKKRPPPVLPLPGCEWKTAPLLEPVIAVERRAALGQRVGFFDVFTAMGGPNQMDDFTRRKPKWAYGDHVHLAAEGHNFVARHFMKDLLSRYDAWAAARDASPVE